LCERAEGMRGSWDFGDFAVWHCNVLFQMVRFVCDSWPDMMDRQQSFTHCTNVDTPSHQFRVDGEMQ
jgi:hypothetical protein